LFSAWLEPPLDSPSPKGKRGRQGREEKERKGTQEVSSSRKEDKNGIEEREKVRGCKRGDREGDRTECTRYSKAFLTSR
jgi:hypothetical protein